MVSLTGAIFTLGLRVGRVVFWQTMTFTFPWPRTAQLVALQVIFVVDFEDGGVEI